MKYDNDRNRFTYGYDAGQVVEGEIQQDPDTKEFVLVDDEGIAFSTQEFMKTLVGKKVRFTCATFETLENIEKMIAKANTQGTMS